MERELLGNTVGTRPNVSDHQRHAIRLSVVSHVAVVVLILASSTRVLAPESQPGVPAMTVFAVPAPSGPTSVPKSAAAPKTQKTRARSRRLNTPPPSPVRSAIRVGGAIRPPLKTKDVPALYPPLARAAGVQGVVVVEVTIGADGRVVDVRTLRSIPPLDESAVEAVRRWEFMPTLVNSVATPVIMSVSVQFTLP